MNSPSLWGRIESSSEQRRFLSTDYQMRGEQVERRLAAVLLTDVAGYSRLMGEDAPSPETPRSGLMLGRAPPPNRHGSELARRHKTRSSAAPAVDARLQTLPTSPKPVTAVDQALKWKREEQPAKNDRRSQ
jgi:hypothetical protein